MKSVPAIAFDYRPSRWLLSAIVAVACLASIAILSSGFGFWIRFGSVALVVLYTACSLRKFRRAEFAQVLWRASGDWRARDRIGREQVGELAHAVVLGFLIVLVLRVGPERTRALWLLPDNCDAETRRRLRVRLSRADSVDIAA